MTPITILVTGGRAYDDRTRVFGALDYIYETHGGIGRLVHGGATGADALANKWAYARKRPEILKVYPAQWKLYGRSAGILRNGEMLREEDPDLVVAFPGGRGTADMIARAEARGVNVIHFQ